MKRSGNPRRTLFSTLRRGMLFSVGSALILREKTADFVEQAIERGQEVQDEGKTLVQEMRAERKARTPQRIDTLDVRVTNTLKRLDVPTHQDIVQLDQHITELAERIEELQSP
jgi:polyhydroxyalkanoate synthesis regulator phasin